MGLGLGLGLGLVGCGLGLGLMGCGLGLGLVGCGLGLGLVGCGLGLGLGLVGLWPRNIPAEPSTSSPPKKQLSFCHLNIRSLVQQSDCGTRFDHLYNYVCRDNIYDVIALTETHLSDDIDDDEINLDGYTLFRLDRNRHGGGTALYCRSELEPKLISNLSIANIEMLWIETSVHQNKIVFGVCYRPPNQNTGRTLLFLR